MQKQFARFIRERITELRMKKELSEHQMSYDLEKSRSYIYNISSGNALPSMKELLKIIEYFEMMLGEFFDDRSLCPSLIQKAIVGMNNLNEDDMEVILAMIGRLSVMREALNGFSKNESNSKKALKLK